MSVYNTAEFDIHMSVHRNIIPNYSQQDATFLDLFVFTDALHVSGGSSAHHQEHINVHTASGIGIPLKSENQFIVPLIYGDLLSPSALKQYLPIVTWWPTASCMFPLRLPYRYHDVPGFTLTAKVCDGTRRHLIMIWRSDILPTALPNTLAMQQIRSQ
jgi:hypothetical protein